MAERPRAAPLELRLANDHAEIAHAHRVLDEFLADPELSAKPIAATRLVVEELVANAICYAFPQGGRHEIRLAVELEPDHVLVEISDDGIPFDPFAQPPAPAANNLAEATIGGRGLRLVRAVTCGRSYRREADRNVVELRIPR